MVSIRWHLGYLKDSWEVLVVFMVEVLHDLVEASYTKSI